MGKLRQIGKKIKKGVKKLLGGKFGKILGGIGLAMMFWGGANALFGNMDWFTTLKNKLPKMDNFATTTVSESSELAGEALTGGPDISGLSKAGPGTVTTTKTVPLKDVKFSDLNVGEKIAKVGVEGADLAYKAGEKVVESLKPGPDFFGNVAEDVTGAYLLSEIAGDDDIQTGGRGIVMNKPDVEMSYNRAVAQFIPSVAKDFNTSQLFYGTLSENYLLHQAQQFQINNMS